MHVPGLRRPHAKVGGIVYFGRMLDKMRLRAIGKLPADYNVGTTNWWDFDSRCTRFLHVDYNQLVKRVQRGGSDLSILRWCFKKGRKPGTEDMEIWNTFMQKRGWKDDSSRGLQEEKESAGFGSRKNIVTWFDLIDAEEKTGPKTRGK